MIELALKYWYAIVIALLMALLGVQEVRLAHSKAELATVQKDEADAKAAALEVAQLRTKAQQHANEELDAKYTKELDDAKQQIIVLADDVRSGQRRLRLNAVCTGSSGKTPGSPGVDDGTGARLTPEAERNYFGLRADIETANKQIAGLQEYVRNVCQK